MKAILEFLTEAQIEKLSTFQLNSSFDLLDTRFGKNGACSTCKESRCDGHYANLNIKEYIYHPIYVRYVLQSFNDHCHSCGYEVDISRAITKSPKLYCNGGCQTKKDQPMITMKAFMEKYKPADVREQLLAWRASESKYIIKNILIPPPGIRPKDDVKWPSDLSNAYQHLLQIISKSSNYNAISGAYDKLSGTSGIINKQISGKYGIFRELMKGKRLDKSVRSVIVGDPMIDVDQVLVPKRVAEKITVKEICHMHNVSLLKKEALQGRVFWNKTYVTLGPDDIIQGQEYERCIRNDDYVLFNRQPSLSTDSLMAFRVKIRTTNSLAIALNPIVSSPYNADFDGDEMNMFFDWTIPSQAELLCLCDVRHSHSLKPIQDTITGSYIMTHENITSTVKMYIECATIINKKNIIIPRVVTGRDIFKLAIPEGIDFEINKPVDKDVICSIIPNRIRRVRARSEQSTRTMNEISNYYRDLQKIVARWLMTYGFGVTAKDCMWSRNDIDQKKEMAKNVNADDYSYSQVEFSNWVNEKCVKEEYKNKALMKMVNSKSKGNIINVAQIMGSVGHQYIDKQPIMNNASKLENLGFVQSSYLEGLTPTEYMRHSIAARTGVINTGVSTSNTGYLNRKGCIIMADCAADYMGGMIEGEKVISFPSQI